MAETIVKQLIIHININSLIKLSRRYYLSIFLNKYNPDLVLINETKLNPKHKLNFENYYLIRKNSKMGGGTAILIRKNIKFSYYNNKDIHSFRHLETTVVKIPLFPNKYLYIISSYYPSGNNCSYFRQCR